MKVLQRYAVWIAITQMKASVLHGIGRRRIIPTTILTRGTFISVAASWTAIASTIMLVFVVSQASDKNIHPCTFLSTSLRQSLKHRFCLEQAASVPLLRYLFNFSIRPKGRIEKKFF